MIEFLENGICISEEQFKTIFEGCISNLIELHITDMGNNLADYVGQLISFTGESRTREVGLKMLKVLASIAKEKKVSKDISSFRKLLSDLPFLPNPSEESEVIIASVVEGADEGTPKDIDLVSQGKVETYSVRVVKSGTVK